MRPLKAAVTHVNGENTDRLARHHFTDRGGRTGGLPLCLAFW